MANINNHHGNTNQNNNGHYQKNQNVINIGEDVEKLEHLGAVNWSAKQYVTIESSMKAP